MKISSLSKVKNPKRTQVVVENLVLGDLLSQDAKKFLNSRLAKYGQPVVASIQLFLVPKKGESVDKKERVESLNFEQPSPAHLEAKKSILTASFSKILDDILK